MNTAAYASYYADRRWDEVVAAEQFWYFDALQGQLERLGLAPGPRRLDLGFGDGSFLDWCRARGHDPVGMEIQERAVEAAQARGHRVLMGPLGAQHFAPAGCFDAVFLFDVAEHLSHAQLQAHLALFMPLLADGGLVVLRFPNAASPFSAPIQHGDLTHVAAVSPALVEAMGRAVGLRARAVFNDRFLPPGLWKGLRRRAVYALRTLIETVLSYAYFGRRLPMDPNVFVVLSK